MSAAPDLTFLSVIDILCIVCRAKKPTFVCFCGKDICLECALKHQKGCQSAINLTFAKTNKQEQEEKRKWKTKRRR